MKLILHLTVLFLLAQCHCNAQEKELKRNDHPTGRSSIASLGFHLPLGEFSETHSIGIAVLYARSRQRFGRMEQVPVKKFGFTYDGGIAFYSGKKEKVGLVYTYDYPYFIYLHTHAGIIYNPCRNGNIRLVAGPALGRYDGVTRFNIGAQLGLSYFPIDRFGICPGISLHLEPGTAPLAAATIQFQFAF